MCSTALASAPTLPRRQNHGSHERQRAQSTDDPKPSPPEADRELCAGLSKMATDSLTVYRSQIDFRVGSGTLVETAGNLSNGPFVTLETRGNLSNGLSVTFEHVGNLWNGPFVMWETVGNLSNGLVVT